MTATAVAPATQASPSPYRRSFGGDVRSEWIKLRTLRSTWWVAGATLVVIAGFGLLTAFLNHASLSDEQLSATMGGIFTPTEIITSGAQLAYLILAVLGVLVVTNEYSSGMIRSTLAATPTRVPVLLAKAVVLGLTSLVLTVVGLVLAALVAMPVLAMDDISLDLADADAQRTLWGTLVFLVLISLMALGFGAILRHTAGAISTVVALLFVVPIVLFPFNNDVITEIEKYLPSSAANAFMTTSDAAQQGLALLSPEAGLAVMIAWAVVPLVIGAVLLKRRDA
ncbi:ABC-2 type transport system permease protein [Sediminihabitans luteus]|uniref:ABC-2 type transport system permease protein n=1 Tax=Sediminihabitans luteus TaxID=1138585 RepID=A0A2M9CDF8_9CELL|nr:ABC transporter permease subunit [Sediminihabitans luteus]PJJ69905.1 ABC-2 type transport system permease protein [Sediminihabitans luteus]GII99225.1 ABC transporter permease [Sediminihabitans luteus]